MTPRLNKRQQREREELEALGGPSRLPDGLRNEDSSEDESPLLSNAGPSRGFTALAEDGGADQESDPGSDEDKPKSSPKSKKSKKKKKGITSPESNSPQPKVTKGKKTKEPSSKRKKNTADDDFDKVLAELSEKHSKLQNTRSPNTSASLSSFDSFNSLLGVSVKYLDPESELRRFFGSKVVSSSRPIKTSRMQASGRSHLARPQPTWPPSHYRAGLSMRELTLEEIRAKGTGVGQDERERWWTFEASPRYKDTTYEFMQGVMGGDPQLFFDLLREMPWHADTLLQTAEVFRHREEYSGAGDFLSRVLFAYERGFAAPFNLTTGIHRLDFDYVENRVFYLALSRNVVDLNRRGTPRTAFEFARLLFALDPHTDPHGALLQLDCLALKAGEASWLLDMWDTYEKMRQLENRPEGETRFDVTMMPGWHWARALALFDRDDDQGRGSSTQALFDAIVAYPSVLPLLADKADITIPARLRSLDAFKIVTDYSSYRDDLPASLIHLLSHVYALRSGSLWKQASRTSWLSSTLDSLCDSLCEEIAAASAGPARKRLCTLFSEQSNVTDAIYRHVAVVAPLVPEFRRLTAFFPGDVKKRLAETIEGDPLPPLTMVSSYEDEAYFGISALEEGRSGLTRLVAELQRLFPTPIERRHLEALFNDNPEVGEHFAGEAVEMAQIVRRFPEEMFDAMQAIVDEVNGVFAAEDEGRMAGGEDVREGEVVREVEDEERVEQVGIAEVLAEGEVEFEGGGEGEVVREIREDEDEDEEEEDDSPSLPVRLMRTFVGRLWGRRTEDSDSDEGDDVRAQAR